MSQAKRTSKRKRSKKAVPILGAAGLALSLASGASAATAVPAPDTRTQQTAVSLAEEEISDVSLGTFYASDKEHGDTPRRGIRLAMGVGGCAGCAGCGGCWTGTYYDGSAFGNEANPPHQVKPAHKYARPVKHKRVVKNP